MDTKHRRNTCSPTADLNPEPYTLHPTPYTLHPSPYTLRPTPYTPHPKPYTLIPKPWTLNPKPYEVWVRGTGEVPTVTRRRRLHNKHQRQKLLRAK